MKKKILVAIEVMTIIILLLTILQGKVNATTLQSNPNTHYKLTSIPETFMNSIRSIEASGGAMGLSETVNEDQTFKGDSNNIDVHMMRNTEYGAIAILSVSGYGNSKTIPNSTIKSTTGNETGVYYTTTGSTDNTHYEIMAGGLSGNIFSGINTKYYDSYSSNRIVKVGDALDLKWQGTDTDTWIDYRYPYSLRNYLGYFGYGEGRNYGYYSRGVAVCGTGF